MFSLQIVHLKLELQFLYLKFGALLVIDMLSITAYYSSNLKILLHICDTYDNGVLPTAHRLLFQLNQFSVK